MLAMNPLDLDWARIGRWTLLGAIVMLIWMLVPVAKCSLQAFREEPIGEVADQSPAAADKQRVEQGRGFFSRWGRAIKGCYAKTPLMSNERWKITLLFVFCGFTALGWTVGFIERRRKRSYDR
jgi:hypothetical protein